MPSIEFDMRWRLHLPFHNLLGNSLTTDSAQLIRCSHHWSGYLIKEKSRYGELSNGICQKMWSFGQNLPTSSAYPVWGLSWALWSSSLFKIPGQTFHSQTHTMCAYPGIGRYIIVVFEDKSLSFTFLVLCEQKVKRNSKKNHWTQFLNCSTVRLPMKYYVSSASALPTLSSRRASMMLVVNWWDLTIIAINHGEVSQVSSLTVALGFPNPLETALTEAINFLAHQTSICMLFNLKMRHKPNVHCCWCNRLQPKHSSIKSKLNYEAPIFW